MLQYVQLNYNAFNSYFIFKSLTLCCFEAVGCSAGMAFHWKKFAPPQKNPRNLLFAQPTLFGVGLEKVVRLIAADYFSHI